MPDPSNRQPIAVTMGDPAGVGPEVAARAWAARRENNLPPFVAIGDIAAIAAAWDGPVARVGDMDEVVRRSEEHTSELQSLMRISYAVFCLKKKIYNRKYSNHNKKH